MIPLPEAPSPIERDLNAYLAALGEAAPLQTIADIVAFNEAHPQTALKYGG